MRVKKEVIIRYTLNVDESVAESADLIKDIQSALEHCFYNDFTPPCITVGDPGAHDVVKEKKPWQIATRTIDVPAIFEDILVDFGIDRQGNRVGKARSPYLYVVRDISINQARAIKRYVDKILNPHDRYCELRYDKETRTATCDIVS